MTGVETIEETTKIAPRFGAGGLIAVAATDWATGRLLMIAWMNEEAFKLSLETGEAHYWSRSRKKLWRKGETSGHRQRIVSMRIDCDQDAVELVVEQTGPACHTGRQSCFYRTVSAANGEIGVSFNEPARKEIDRA